MTGSNSHEPGDGRRHPLADVKTQVGTVKTQADDTQTEIKEAADGVGQRKRRRLTERAPRQEPRPSRALPSYPADRDGLFQDVPGAFGRRIEELGGELSGEEIEQLWEVGCDVERDLESVRDALSTRLMEFFRLYESRACFGLLYEFNSAAIAIHVAQRLRRYHSRADAGDLLQEVFFNIYRYPSRFDSSRDDAFRVWTATIVCNTVLKHLRSLSRSGRAEVPFEDLSEHPETGEVEPLGGVIERESEGRCRGVYVLYLHMYLQLYRQLSEREQRALHLVEVENVSYRDAAGDLGIKLENLKMVIFRARRKIHRAMHRIFEGNAPELRAPRETQLAPKHAPKRRAKGTHTIPKQSNSVKPRPVSGKPTVDASGEFNTDGGPQSS